MATEWAQVPLGEIVQNFDARRIPLSSREREIRRGPYPYYGATGVMDYVDGFLFEGLHLLVAEDGSVERPDGKPFLQIVTGQFWVNNHAHVLKGTTDDDTRFIYYALSTIAIRPFMSGSVQAKLSQANLNKIPIPYPADKEARRTIARVLGTLDNKIELKERTNETLEEIAQALFEAWFVDFEPVRAKADGREPGFPQKISDLFPARLVDSELGEMPEGWEVATVRDQVACIKGRSYKSEELQDSQIALVTLKSFARGGGYRPDGLKPYKGDYRPEQVVQPGELVIACTDVTQAAEVIGKPALVESNDEFETLVASLDVLVVRPSSRLVSVPFLYCLFRTDFFSHYTYAHTTGTTVLHLSKDAVSSFRFALPEKRISDLFASIASPIFKRINQFEEEARTLANLRDALLRRLISGELRAKDSAQSIEEVF